MNNPQYKQLFDEQDHFVGFERTVVEYNPAGQDFWQLEPIDHDPDRNIKIDKIPVGIESLRRP